MKLLVMLKAVSLSDDGCLCIMMYIKNNAIAQHCLVLY